MTDLVQRLRDMVDLTSDNKIYEAADRIEQLEAGVVEQCNVNRDLRVKLEQLERENVELRKDAEKLTPKQMEDFVRLLRNDALEEAAVKCDELSNFVQGGAVSDIELTAAVLATKIRSMKS